MNYIHRKGLRFIGALSVIAVLFACKLPPSIPLVNPGTHFKKIFIVILENTNYEDALKQPFQAQLAFKGGLLTQFNGVAHPSQPNYIALISGATQGVTGDSNVTVNAQHIGDLLAAKGMRWKTYAENFPGSCFLGATSGDYARKHVPFLSFKNVQTDAQRCDQIVEASELETDLRMGTLPEFSLYIPNLRNDGHNTTPAFSDQWMSDRFGKLLEDPNFMKDLLFVVTYDESETYVGNHIATILYGDSIKAGSTSALTYNHYSLLRTIEEELGLGSLKQNDAIANSINEVWK
ncbi:alkaline phosphatase family protein [Bdellovibrionota bacterium FG-1]